MRASIATLLIVALTVLGAPAARALPVEVNVRIEGRSQTLFEGPILTEGHDVQASSDVQERTCDGTNGNRHSTPGPTPTAASVDAMNLVGETFDGRWDKEYEDYFITRWGPDEEKEGKSWGLVVNNVFTTVGGCQYELSTGNEVVWIYNAFESRPILGLFAASEHYSSGTRPLTAEAQLNQPFEIEVAAFGDGQGQPPPTPERTSMNTKPYAGALVSPVSTTEKGFETVQTGSSERVVTNGEGKASITFTTPGWHRIMAGAALEANGEEGAIRSNRLDVCVPATEKAGCGAPLPEDELRTPPRYLQNPAPDEHHEEAQTGGGSGMESQSPPSTGSQAAGTSSSVPGAKSPEGTIQSKGSSARLSSVSISQTRVVLTVTGPGPATVSVARWAHAGRRYSWRTFKRITVEAHGAGRIEVRLPRLAAGRYRVTVGVPGGRAVAKTLTVTRKAR